MKSSEISAQSSRVDTSYFNYNRGERQRPIPSRTGPKDLPPAQKKGKTAGIDNIPAELVQAGGEDVISAL